MKGGKMPKSLGMIMGTLLVVVPVGLMVVMAFQKNKSGADERLERRELANGIVVFKSGETTVHPKLHEEALSLLGAGNFESAEAVFVELKSKEPQSSVACVGVGTCKLRTGDLDGAVAEYQRALELQPRSIPALLGMGNVNRKRIKYSKATEYFSEILNIDPKCPDGHRSLAESYSLQGRKAEAREHLEEFKRLAPDSMFLEDLEKRVGK